MENKLIILTFVKGVLIGVLIGFLGIPQFTPDWWLAIVGFNVIANL